MAGHVPPRFHAGEDFNENIAVDGMDEWMEKMDGFMQVYKCTRGGLRTFQRRGRPMGNGRGYQLFPTYRNSIQIHSSESTVPLKA